MRGVPLPRTRSAPFLDSAERTPLQSRESPAGTLSLLKMASALIALQEHAESLQCLIRDIEIYPDKIVLNIFELPEFEEGSQRRSEWLPGSNSLHKLSQFVGGIWVGRSIASLIDLHSSRLHRKPYTLLAPDCWLVLLPAKPHFPPISKHDDKARDSALFVSLESNLLVTIRDHELVSTHRSQHISQHC